LMILQTSTVVAQEEEPPLPPEDLTEPWFPPDEGLPGATLTLSLTLTTGGSGPFMAWFTDAQGNRKTEFRGSDVLFFWIQTNFAVSRVWVAEYYPPGSSPNRHWIMWRQFLPNAGTWMWGPFIFETLEPEGLHSWRIWMRDLTTGNRLDQLARFNYKSGPEATSTKLSVSQTSLKPTDSVTLTSMTSDKNGTPVPGGTVTMSYNAGSGWAAVPSCSGSVSGGSYTCTWKPGSPGTYSVKADYSGQGQDYQPSSSQAVTIEVEVPASVLSLAVNPTDVEVGDAVIVSGKLAELSSGSPVSGAFVVVSLTSPNESDSKSVQTGGAGDFSYKYTVAKAGDFTVQASYAGDKLHKPAAAPPVYFKATQISVQVTVETDKAEVGRDVITGSTPEITLAGSTDPELPNVKVRIEIKGAASVTETVGTEADGTFSYTFTPSKEGDYKIVAYFDGDDQYAKAMSTSLKITVGKNWTTSIIIALVAIVVVLGVAYWRGIIPPRRRPLPVPPPPAGLVCPSCGTRNRPGSSFCKRCSTSLRPGPGTLCPSCRTANKPTASFCRRCGARLR
jgi:hypothetical protein